MELNDPVHFSKGINLREAMTTGTEFQIDMDFKRQGGHLINGDDDLYPDMDNSENSDSEDILKVLEDSTERQILSSPEYHSFRELAAKMIDCDVNGDAKILIIEEGEGPLVPEDAEVTLHYAAYWEKATIPFDSTLTVNGGVPSCLRLTDGIIPGLHIALTTIKGPAARFLLLLNPALAWGSQGVPPRIRPEPALFVVVLYDVRDVGAAFRFNDLPSMEQAKYEVTIRTVTSLHKQAKDFYTKKKYNPAIKNYQQSINVLNLSHPDNETEETEVKRLKINSLLNLAVCYSKMKKPKYVIRSLDSLDYLIDVEKNCKALFYYGKANEAMNKSDVALEFYKKALELEPKNKDIGKALHNLDNYLKKSAKDEKEMWKMVFDNKDKKQEIAVDEEFKGSVRATFEDLARSDEYAKFDLPSGLERNEVDYVKELAKDFENFVVLEDGKGKKKQITIVKKVF